MRPSRVGRGCDLLLGRRTDRTALALVRRKPIAFPPALVRDPLVHASVRALQRCDDEGRPAREPLLLRALNRLF